MESFRRQDPLYFGSGVVSRKYQLPTLVRQVQTILRDYDERQILKELVQNAEDAGAKQVKLLYDETQYPSHKLVDRILHQFQGPALYAYNNELFTEADWQGIGSILNSVKEDDLLKVGQFGLGFKSVFHITDFPCVMSGDCLELIDPHNKYFQHEIADLNLKESRVQRDYQDQIKPFEVFGSRGLNTGHYDGTLFRFPLRSGDMKSELTDAVYDRQKVSYLFESYKHEAHLNLLFLRNIEEIEVLEKLSGQQNPSLRFKVEIQRDCLAEVREQREKFKKHLKLLVLNPLAKHEPLTVTYRMDILLTHLSEENGYTRTTSSWMVSQHYDGTEISPQFRAMKCLPLAGTALPVNTNIMGNVFCFLPLPSQETSPTGLPFHVHGYFALDHNRKHIKLPGGGEVPDLNEQWNLYLLQKCLPTAMATAMIRFAQSCMSGTADLSFLMAAIPDPVRVIPSWALGVRSLIEIIKDYKILYTEAGGGRWVNVRNAVFEGSSIDFKYRDTINEVLIAADISLVIVPQHVQAAFKDFIIQTITPQMVAQAYFTIQKCTSMSSTNKVNILNYLLKNHTLIDFEDLELLPLLNGTFTKFSRKCQQKVYIPTHEHRDSLLPGLEHRLVDTTRFLPMERETLKSTLLESGQGEPLSPASVKDLLPLVFPRSWSSFDMVTWTSRDKPISAKFLAEIWIYLSRYFGQGLTSFDELHLLPLNGKLMRLREARRVVLVPSLHDTDAVEALRELSVIVADDVPEFVSSHPQMFNGHFMSTYSVKGVLTAIKNAADGSGLNDIMCHFKTSASAEQKNSIRNLLCAECNRIPYDLVDIARCLPVFETCFGCGFKCDDYVSLRDNPQIAPMEKLPIRCPLKMIEATDAGTRKLVITVGGMIQVSVMRMLLEIFGNLRGLTVHERMSLEEFLLRSVDKLKPTDDEELRMYFAHLIGSPLFSNREGQFTAVKDMFVTDKELVNVLIEDAAKFPSHHGETVLKQIGLKTDRDISSQEILLVAQKLDSQWQNPGSVDTRKSITLLNLLTKYPEKLQDFVHGAPLKGHLKKLRWLSCSRDPPAEHYPSNLRWFGKRAQFKKPEDCHIWNSAYLVGSVAPVANMDVEIAKGLGLNEAIYLDLVFNHLENVVGSYYSQEKDNYLRIAKQIYRFIRLFNVDVLGSNLKSRNTMAWIWHGDGFATLHQMAIQPRTFAGSQEINCKADIDLRPYIYTLPPEMEEFEQLFRSCGMNKNCDLLSVLESIRDKHLQKSNPNKSTRDLKISLAILEEVKPKKGEALDDNVRQRLLVPIESGDPNKLRFAPLVDCTGRAYDMPGFFEENTELKICHTSIPMSTADLLGIPSPVGRYLTDNSEALGMEFGQHEKLTNRIKRILTGYSRKTILKELLQNADDAVATEMHLVIDPRSHSTRRIFGDKWKPLQGPALLVYNNKPFTEQDMKGIQNLGEGTKGDDPTKTGQYGIGFNCVYHLTDVPMFLTKGKEIGENLCVFDPRCNYVFGAHNRCPGRRYKDLRDIRLKFPDVLEGFLQNYFEMEESTMFRFPLRTHDSSLGKSVNLQEITELMDYFRAELSVSMLFLNHLQRVVLSTVDERSGRMIKMYQVDAKLNAESTKTRKQFSEYLKRVGNGLTSGSIDITQLSGRLPPVLYDMEITDTNGNQREYRIGQQLGYDTAKDIPRSIIDGYRRDELALLPRGGVAILRSETAAALQPDKSTISCFLPLPLEPKLPDGVHINGHFALDYESRRSLCLREIPGLRADWNEQMMMRVIGPLYATMIEDNTAMASQLGAKGLKKHKNLFPQAFCRNQLDLYCDALHDAVYQTINKKAMLVLPVTRFHGCEVEWHSLHDENVLFDDLHHCEALKRDEVPLHSYGVLTRPKKHRDPPPYENVRSVLLKSSVNLLDMPLGVHNSFKLAKVDVKVIQPHIVTKFFSTHPMKNELPMPLQETSFENLKRLKDVVTYCKEEGENFFGMLAQLPFLVTSDMQLRVADTPGVYLTRYQSLISNQQHKFVHPEMIQLFTSYQTGTPTTFRTLNVIELAKLMELDPNCRIFGGGRELPYTKNYKAWLYTIWRFLKEEADQVIKGSWHSALDDGDRRKLDALLAPLSNWSLFPVTRMGHIMLFPLAKAATAVDLGQGGLITQSLHKILRKVNFPEPYYNCLYEPSLITWETSPLPLAKALAASVDNPAGVLHSLEDLLQNSTAGDLSTDDANYLLRYFSDNLGKIKKVPSAITILRQLPYYETVKTGLISLGRASVYVIHRNIPKEDMDSWESGSSGQIFLKRDKILKPLHDFLGCITFSEVEVYTTLVLEQTHFENMMSDEGRMIHLDYIAHILIPKLQRKRDHVAEEALLDKMAMLRFIPGVDGGLLQASEMFDPEHNVLRVMYMNDSDHFPPENFRTAEWLSLLRKIGLKCEVTKDMFLEFAIAVAADATKDANNEISKIQSKALVAYLLNKLEQPESYQWLNENFLRKVGSIPFIVPHRAKMSLQSLHPQYCPPSFAKYDGSFIGTDSSTSLLWTSSVLLPIWAQPTRRVPPQSLKWLGVAITPTVDSVVRHLVKLCKYQSIQPVEFTQTFSRQLLVVLIDIYGFLTCSDFDKSTLKDALQPIKCIPVEKGSKLVYPEQVVIDIHEDEEIKPYLYKIPLEVAQFSDLFRELGVKKKPSALHYAAVLGWLYSDTGGEAMTPPELYKAVKAFVCLIDSAAVGPLNKNPPIDPLTQLYLPSREKKLVSSQEVIFNDDEYLEERLKQLSHQFIIDDQSCVGQAIEFKWQLVNLKSTRMKHFFNTLPDFLQPVYLPTVTREVMEGQDFEENQATSDMAERIGVKLRDNRFTESLQRVISHDRQHSETEEEAVSPAEQEEQIRREIANGLANIKIVSVADTIITYLVYKDERVEGSEQVQEIYSEKNPDEDGNTIWTLYVASNSDGFDAFSPFWNALSDLVDKLTGYILRRSTKHLKAMLQMDIDRIPAYLDKNRIKRLTQKETVSYFPTIGERIPINVHHLLQPDLLDFEDMEYVGVEVYNPVFDVEEGEEEYEGSNIPIYIHGRVISEVKEKMETSFQRMYKVMVSCDKTVTVNALRLHKWCRRKAVLSPDGDEKDDTEKNLTEIKASVTSVLESAYSSLDDEQRLRVVYRLLQTWQPLANKGREALSEVIVTHIESEVNRLDKMNQTNNDTYKSNMRDYFCTYHDSTPHRQIVRGTEYLKRYTMAQAQAHREHRDQYLQDYNRSENRQRGWSVVPPTFSTTNPQPGEARRWLKQAKYDLQAIPNDMVNENRAFEWACLKSHQAAEKALKAVHYSKDYRSHDSTHHLQKLASDLNDEVLCNLASTLHNLIGDSTKMRYPDNLRPPWVPHDVFNQDKALNAQKLAKQIVTRAERIILPC